MFSDNDLALLLQQQYDVVSGAFDTWSLPDSTVSWALKHYGYCDVIAFEGSHDLPDWERDFAAQMIPVRGLGAVHAGFYEGLPDVLTAVMPLLRKDRLIKVCGHSLGGGEAHIFTGMLVNAGFSLLETITFGSPLPGDQQLADLIGNVPNRPYWNYLDGFTHDLVGSVPEYIPLLEPYVFPRERIKGWSAPTPANPWGQGHHLAPHNLKDCYLPLMKGLQNG